MIEIYKRELNQDLQKGTYVASLHKNFKELYLSNLPTLESVKVALPKADVEKYYIGQVTHETDETYIIHVINR